MKRFFIFARRVLFFSLLVTSASPAFSAGFKAATAVTDITPSNNGFSRMFLGGYAFRDNNPADGLDPDDPLPLTIRALAIEDSTGQPKVIVTADVLGIPHALRQYVVQQVSSLYGLPERNLWLAASHTHSGPVLTGNLDPAVSYTGLSSDGLQGSSDLTIIGQYTDWFKQAVINLVGEALSNLADAPDVTLAYGLTDAPLGVNRIGLSTFDHDLPVMTVRSTSDGSMIAILFGYAAHPTAGDDYHYRPDYPGVTRENLEETFGGLEMFLQGAAGDVAPDYANYPTWEEEGGLLADAITDLISSGDMQPVTGPIITESRELNLPLNIDPNDADHQDMRALYDEIRGLSGIESNYVRHANQIIEQIDDNKLPVTEPWPVQVWHFGAINPLVIAGLGGEATSGYSLDLKEQFSSQLGSRLWVAAYTNEVPGYIPTKEVWDYAAEGDSVYNGYEAGWICGSSYCSPLISSFGVSQMYYGWPAPLRRGDIDTGGTTKGMEEFVLETTSEMIQSPPWLCPQPAAFWLSHSNDWPISSFKIGGQKYSHAQLVSILSSNRRDASGTLAKEVIAALLNEYRGADPAPVSTALAQANKMLKGSKVPANIKPGSRLGKRMTNAATALRNYNTGLLTSDCE